MKYGRTRVKVCCISSVEEASLAIRHGADAIGLVSRMPSGPGVIDDELIAEIAQQMPASVSTFLLTSEPHVDAIVEQQRRLRPDTLQLVDRLQDGTHADLRAALPGIAIVQVIHVLDRSSIDEALEVAPVVDALLLDSGNPEAPVKELGGTGRLHDWTLSREIVRRSPVSVFLAGGLAPGNVAAAIREVRPYGVDVCSGLRTGGRLDEGKVAAFFEQVGSAG